MTVRLLQKVLQFLIWMSGFWISYFTNDKSLNSHIEVSINRFIHVETYAKINLASSIESSKGNFLFLDDNWKSIRLENE